MSSYGEFMKQKANSERKRFFGESLHKVSNKYVNFDRVIDDDNIVVITNNVKIIKGNYVMLVDNNKGVYLKNWQVKHVRNDNYGIEAYAVKLNRNYFKPYTFSFDFSDMAFEEEDTFENLKEHAKEQDMPIVIMD